MGQRRAASRPIRLEQLRQACRFLRLSEPVSSADSCELLSLLHEYFIIFLYLINLFYFVFIVFLLHICFNCAALIFLRIIIIAVIDIIDCQFGLPNLQFVFFRITETLSTLETALILPFRLLQ